ISVIGLALSIGFAGVAVPASPASAVEVSVNTPLTMASGATFTAPMGWRVTSAANKIVLEPPEADSHVALLDVHAADAASELAAEGISARDVRGEECPSAGR